ncbi:MATE family efflux transporter [Alteromonas lipolytica]|uniref:MATE family efflux transporter n=1 Tax=Alteromonas lipolytica TaxID=1856405 RepID=A0A1E8FJ91_9ALTE|nr:MATE family efflux transporter [Alteromonas lipolytica]OFI35503.1 MATE family efflux transporter [Alteromonas lipolytica]GGF76795.1 MATE family efflux transporter [Alteromonas lipolytica]
MATSSTLLTGPIHKALLSLAIPIVISQLLQSAYQLTDAFWVGRLGPAEVAAVSISMPVTFLAIAIGAGLAMAGATLAAQYMGAGKQDEVDKVSAQTLLMVLIVSTLLGACGYWLSPHFLTLLNVEPAVYTNALNFMHVSFIGVIFVFTFNMFQALMRGIGEVKIPLLIVLGTVLLNLVLDPLFIFGFGSFEGLGVTGAALATLVTQALAAIIGVVILLKGRHGIHVHLRYFVPDYTYIRRAFFLGIPGSVDLSARALGQIIMSFLVASFGTVTIASYGVGNNILMFVTIPALGLGMAISTLVGQNLGAGQIERASQAAITGTIWGFVSLTIVGGLSFLLAPQIIAFFVPEQPQVIVTGAEFVKVMALTWGGMAVQVCITGAFRASGNMMNAMVLSLLSQWMFLFPIAFVLSKHTELGKAGIWWAFAAANILIGIVSVCWLARGSWKHTKLTNDDQEVLQVTEETLRESDDRYYP